MDACREGDLATVKTLSMKVKVEHVWDDFSDRTPLHIAAE